MRRVLWLYSDFDPLQSGELRRLCVPALAMEGEDWTCEVSPAAAVTTPPTCDIVVAPLATANALPFLGPAVKVVLEVDTGTTLTDADAAEVLRALSNRIVGVAARGVRAASWANDILEGRAPVWLIPDPAVRRVELEAAALELGLPDPPREPPPLPEGLELWFSEPGDHIDPEEVRALSELWAAEGDAPRLVVAPPSIGEWMRQAGVRAQVLPWSPATLAAALAKASHCVFVGGKTYVRARRQVLALRSGAAAEGPAAPFSTVFQPTQVAASWSKALTEAVACRRPLKAGDRVRVLVFLDLIQDLDPALPLIEALAGHADAELKVVVSGWLARHSPRVAAALRLRGLAFDIWDRAAVLAGTQPKLAGADAVVVVAESSLSAHAVSHALVTHARAERIPTFALQHGVENVALHHLEGDPEATMAADHVFVWFPPGRAAAAAPALRPRMLHVGRAPAPPVELGHLQGAFTGFDSVVAVFENLHWNRYDEAWRARFLTDCAQFAHSEPNRAVILKPHHAGRWSVKNRHLIPHWPSNLIVADPTDPFWEPYSAGALVHLADLVITTPSTVALDAAQAAKPVAIAAYGLELPAYAPLMMIQRVEDWSGFCAQADGVDDARRRVVFLGRTAAGYDVAKTAVAYVVRAAVERRSQRHSNVPLTAASA